MVGFEGARHVISEFVPRAGQSMRRTTNDERVVGLRPPDLSQQTTNVVKDLSASLLRIGQSLFIAFVLFYHLLYCIRNLGSSSNRLGL